MSFELNVKATMQLGPCLLSMGMLDVWDVLSPLKASSGSKAPRTFLSASSCFVPPHVIEQRLLGHFVVALNVVVAGLKGPRLVKQLLQDVSLGKLDGFPVYVRCLRVGL